MTKTKEQTVQQYAKISEIPLKQVLEDLNKAGFSCAAHDELNQQMRKHLSKLFRQRLRPEQRAMTVSALKEREKEALERKKSETIAREKEALEREKEALEYAEAKTIEAQEELIKIGQLIDLCFDLLPETVRASLKGTTDNQTMSQNYIQHSSKHLIQWFVAAKNITNYVKFNAITSNAKQKELYSLHNNLSEIKFSKKTDIPEWIIKDYHINIYRATTNIGNLIDQRKKEKSYTAALIEIIYFLINFDLLQNLYCDLFRDIYYEDNEINDLDFNKKLDFEVFYFIGDLLIDMGAIDHALMLYTIDERVFINSNRLSLLASNAIKQGNLESGLKLITKLIEKEPYHPSIPIIQADIKRLEQREKLKFIFSLDFSKIDELSGTEFENLLMDKFSLMGFQVKSTPKTGDFGADLIVENTEGTKVIVQCKRFKSKVNLKAVQETIGAIGYYAGDMGIVITNNSFLNSAIKLAESHDIELWNGDCLVSFLAGDLSFSKIFNI
ncbi:restriction endonuclease [Methylomicrobium lacus]|uniref:restriction endonuclease n=1 Tax=Methylomicrobium lacus TaxID=136992 RepID=UPI0035A948AC